MLSAMSVPRNSEYSVQEVSVPKDGQSTFSLDGMVSRD